MVGMFHRMFSFSKEVIQRKCFRHVLYLSTSPDAYRASMKKTTVDMCQNIKIILNESTETMKFAIIPD